MAVERFTLQLNTETDAAVIEYIKRQPNKNDAIRRALKMQMEEEAYQDRAIEAHETGEETT